MTAQALSQENHFAELGLPVRAWLDGEALQAAYVGKSRAAHPDHGGSVERAAAVNRAYEVLRAPERRLKHVLELAGPAAAGWRTVPLDGGMMTLFGKLGEVLRAADGLVEKRSRTRSGLGRALLAGEVLRLRELLEGIGNELEGKKREIENELAGWDARWEEGKADGEGWKELAMAQAKLAYVARWQGQVRENLLRLHLD